MTQLAFSVVSAAPDRNALAPTLVFEVAVDAGEGRVVHGLALSCQIRVEPNRRGHDAREAAGVAELFGEPARWGETLRPFVWTQGTATAGAFVGTTKLLLPVTCSYDLEIAASKYFHAIDDGMIPLAFYFAGSLFGESDAGGLAVERISWDSEARHRLPITTWRALMDGHWPDTGWLRLERETLRALTRFKARSAVATWDGAMKALLAAAGQETP
jgi:hypothetical protein